MTQIYSLQLPDTLSAYQTTQGDVIEWLQPISRINIFVGSNNSGKSRFMRLLSSISDYNALTKDAEIEQVNSNISSHIQNIRQALYEAGLTTANDLEEGKLDELQNKLPQYISTGNDSYKDLREIFTRWSSFTEINRTSSRGSMGLGHISDQAKHLLRNTVQEQANMILKQLEQIPMYSEATKLKRVYIPIIRGLRPLDEGHTDLYAERTRKDYFSSNNQDDIPEIFTGLSLYQRLIDMLLGDNQERKAISDYQQFISKNLFEGRPIALIPNPKEKVVVVKIGNEKEQPIHHLGDGIQSAIILSFLPYVTREPTFFFIEEPEMFLHPGLQRKILDFYNSLNKHVFFLTTHSNHFLDITIDIKEASVFTFRKILDEEDNDELMPKFTVEIVDAGHNSSLELLGVRNSSVFLVNATIWVEGITDRWYLRAMLNSYMDHLTGTEDRTWRLEEDVHYSFVEYGGANITHWSFLDYEQHPIEVERLCAKAVVIIDKDGDKKLKRKEDLENILGDRLIVLPCREIENLLPYNTIKEVVLEYEGEREQELPRVEHSSYQNAYLGKFIEERILKGNFKRRGGYKGASGTIKGKVDFCERAVNKINYNTLPEETQEIVQKIYDFIHTQNR